jgi:predicted component of type VI protein secretion system
VTEKTEEQTTDEVWREVGRQFQALGESLAEAFRTAWESEETRQHVQNMQDGLKAMVDHVDQAIKEASVSPEAEKIRGEAEKAAESLRTAGEQTWQEVRPHLLAALNQINAELQRMIDRLKEEPASAAPAAEAAPDEPEGE